MSTAPKTILVAEDDVLVRNLLVYILENENYEVLKAGTAIEAERISSTFHGVIHLLIADESLDTMHARELFTQLQRYRPELKALHISGHAKHTLEQQGALIPGVRFLQKPFLPAVLRDQVKIILAGTSVPQEDASSLGHSG